MQIIKNELEQNFYGISDENLYLIQCKYEKNLNFLNNNYIYNRVLKTKKKLIDISFSSNYNKNYHNELLNRCDILKAFNIEKYFIPIFITATLDGKYRKSLLGYYKDFTNDDLKAMPKYIKEKIKNKIALSITDLKNIFNYKLRIFNNFYTRKYKNHKITYCKVFEPHKKDGVPHLHMLLFIPNNQEIIEDFKKAFLRYFPAPQNSKTDKLTKEQISNGELNGFQISIKNSLAYIMKYLQKTFLNLKNTPLKNIKIDKLIAWYIKNKIRRFTMSKNVVPLWIYRKINFIPSLRDLYHLNNFLSFKHNTLIKDYKNKSFYFEIKETKQIVLYSNKKLIYETYGRVVYEYESNYEFERIA